MVGEWEILQAEVIYEHMHNYICIYQDGYSYFIALSIYLLLMRLQLLMIHSISCIQLEQNHRTISPHGLI